MEMIRKQDNEKAKSMCLICLTESKADIKIEVITLRLCGHQFCKSCFLNYLKFSITELKVVHIRCPVCQLTLP